MDRVHNVTISRASNDDNRRIGEARFARRNNLLHLVDDRDLQRLLFQFRCLGRLKWNVMHFGSLYSGFISSPSWIQGNGLLVWIVPNLFSFAVIIRCRNQFTQSKEKWEPITEPLQLLTKCTARSLARIRHRQRASIGYHPSWIRIIMTSVDNQACHITVHSVIKDVGDCRSSVWKQGERGRRSFLEPSGGETIFLAIYYRMSITFGGNGTPTRYNSATPPLWWKRRMEHFSLAALFGMIPAFIHCIGVTHSGIRRDQSSDWNQIAFRD